MADGYDRFDNNEGSGGGSFVMGLLTGTVLGAGLGMLFAPKAGSELRGQLTEQAGNIANQASEGYRRATENAGQWVEKGKDAAGEWTERGKDIYGKAKDAVNKGAEEAQKYVRDATGAVSNPTTPSTASATGSSTGGSGYGSGSSFGTGSEPTRSTTPAGSTPGTSGTTGTRRS
jgi:gas vesicle protein